MADPMSTPDPQTPQERVPRFVSDHYKIVMHSDDTVCTLICRYCCLAIRPVDRTGRRNWLSANSHTAFHVKEAQR